ncbi:MAG: hypothetical protein M3Q06_07860, partial [Bacteroidota bacterium]|nr:hypothetical protein [Bacteroidota bacterium]
MDKIHLEASGFYKTLIDFFSAVLIGRAAAHLICLLVIPLPTLLKVLTLLPAMSVLLLVKALPPI